MTGSQVKGGSGVGAIAGGTNEGSIGLLKYNVNKYSFYFFLFAFEVFKVR